MLARDVLPESSTDLVALKTVSVLTYHHRVSIEVEKVGKLTHWPVWRWTCIERKSKARLAEDPWLRILEVADKLEVSTGKNTNKIERINKSIGRSSPVGKGDDSSKGSWELG